MPRHRRQWHLRGGKRWAFPWLSLWPGRTFFSYKRAVRGGVLDRNNNVKGKKKEKKKVRCRGGLGGERHEVEVVRMEWVCLQLQLYPYSSLYHILISHSPALYPMSAPYAPAPLLGNGWTHLASFDDLDDDEYEHEEVCLFLPPTISFSFILAE